MTMDADKIGPQEITPDLLLRRIADISAAFAENVFRLHAEIERLQARVDALEAHGHHP